MTGGQRSITVVYVFFPPHSLVLDGKTGLENTFTFQYINIEDPGSVKVGILLIFYYQSKLQAIFRYFSFSMWKKTTLFYLYFFLMMKIALYLFPNEGVRTRV